MNAYELAEQAEGLAYEIPADWSSGEPKNVATDNADMLRQQADRIAELEKEVLMWENAEVPTEVMADLIQELERRGLITTPQIKELSDEEIYKLAGKFWIEGSFDDGELDYVGFARAILKKASFTCNGFCGEQECKENQDGCKRIKKASEK